MLVADSQTDALLLPFLQASEEEEAAEVNQLIAEHLEPTIRRILRRKLHTPVSGGMVKFEDPDIEEVYNDILLKFINRLRGLKERGEGKTINNVRGYIAAIAQNTCDEYLRRKHPQRYYLKNKVRHYLKDHHEFSLWEDTEAGWLAGLAAWGWEKPVSSPFPAPTLNKDQENWAAGMADPALQGLPLGEVLNLLLQAAGYPLELDKLVSIIFRLWGLEDRPAESLDEGDNPLSEQIASEQAGPETIFEYQQLLQRLWQEICQLPRRQQVALLFNLKNSQGVNVITLFPATGVATFEQMAEALGIPVKQFEEIWAGLPMDDLSIAAYLGATRQQVINLRKNARGRLLRRIQAFERKEH